MPDRLAREPPQYGGEVDGAQAGVDEKGLLAPFQEIHRVHAALVDVPGAVCNLGYRRGVWHTPRLPSAYARRWCGLSPYAEVSLRPITQATSPQTKEICSGVVPSPPMIAE